MVDFILDPRRTAVLVVDMQNCFVEGYPISAPGGVAVLARLNRLVGVCRRHGIKVVHTAHVVRPDGSNVGVLGEVVPAVRFGVINDGAPSAALHADLSVVEGDVIVKKPRFGAFHGTDLELILRGHGIDTVIIGGIATNVCCETTAREANARDFKVFFLSDGTATFGLGNVSAEEIQRVVCATLAFAFAQVSSVDEMIAKIEAAAVAAG